ncbi:DUF3846 domain-containing protein [Streptomyces sp. NRRL_B-16638]|jgi:hypothetical protein|uniref:DUF3846 domain-containing protein n=2 Tax=Streptomyces coelicolor TaxID=1902 RepID=Q99Q41_STRCO|nr:DUF3846 domain-containing protein [Streptomyces sp. NRRL_B-16638]AGO88493.1 hypothetical protein [Streptomyces coelicolor]MDX2928842.1 DUF3846 domain-containing protein [Streptomyces sp. NRRL_B-16638]CAC36550.1 hypothetical protein [Streptomyces coelicolor A3(2)]CAC36851.1 hypothetical protein [Streptomyces coelicolor A3(2)]
MGHTPGALLITPEADIVPIDLPANSHERLTVMRSVIRCARVDVVALTSQMDMWLDDEGIYNHPVNKLASLLAVRFGFTHQPYHGPVLLTGGADNDGETVPLTKDKIVALLTSITDLL